MTGRLRITADRRISGLISGDPENPVIPGGPNSVTIDVVRAQFSDFRVESTASDNAMAWDAGSIAGSLSPRLDVDDDLGACSVPTSHAYLSNVRYLTDSQVWTDTPERSFDVDVHGSELFAVNGRHSGRENEIWGKMVVWGGEHSVPDDGGGLDPDYNPDLFVSSFQCEDGHAPHLEAFNGSYAGMGLTNMLRGEVVVDGTPVAIDAPLDPEFDQGTFDASYVCDPDLAARVISQ